MCAGCRINAHVSVSRTLRSGSIAHRSTSTATYSSRGCVPADIAAWSRCEGVAALSAALNRPAASSGGVASIKSSTATAAVVGLAEELLKALHTFEERIVAEGIRKAQVAARAEGLSGDDRNLSLLKDEVCEFESC